MCGKALVRNASQRCGNNIPVAKGEFGIVDFLHQQLWRHFTAGSIFIVESWPVKVIHNNIISSSNILL